MKPSVSWLAPTMLLPTLLACGSPNSIGAVDEATDEAALSSAPTVTTTREVRTVDVPVTANTLTVDGPWVQLRWAALWRYTALLHSPVLGFEVPPRDGEECDETCRAAILARAAARGGRLRGKLLVTREVSRFEPSPGTCTRLVREFVELDLSEATKGVYPPLDAYEFLTLSGGPAVHEDPVPCPAE